MFHAYRRLPPAETWLSGLCTTGRRLSIPRLHTYKKQYLHCALASGAVYCNRSCLCVCVFVAGEWAVSEPYYSQRAQCLRLSERFFILNVLQNANSVAQTMPLCL